eukprot:scaffold44058_cov72-Phaeocystis_antarctica.AAC.2
MVRPRGHFQLAALANAGAARPSPALVVNGKLRSRARAFVVSDSACRVDLRRPLSRGSVVARRQRERRARAQQRMGQRELGVILDRGMGGVASRLEVKGGPAAEGPRKVHRGVRRDAAKGRLVHRGHADLVESVGVGEAGLHGDGR